MSRLALRPQDEFEAPLVPDGQFIVGRLTNDDISRADPETIGGLGPDAIQFLTYDKEESYPAQALGLQTLRGHDHRSHDPFCITSAAPIDIQLILGALVKGRNRIEVSAQNNLRHWLLMRSRTNIESILFDLLQRRQKTGFLEMIGNEMAD